MKIFIKELAWKVPVCVAWVQCTPWINDESLTFWDHLIISFLFILSLDLIRWGLRKDKGPADKEDQQPSTGNTVVPRLQDINVDKLVAEYRDSLLPHVNALCHKSILGIATWSYRQGVEEMIEKQKHVSQKELDNAYLKGINDAKHELEKQGEQKPVDKVEPKFKVGDWIVNKGNSYLIADIDYLDNRYLFEIGGYTHEQLNWEYIKNADEHYHLWTIQDAKDGDELYCKSGDIEYIVMNKGVNEHGNIDSYFRYNSLDGFDVDIPSVLSTRQDNITPATKTQRDFLFQKMKEAGYEWDVEKKELKLLITNGGDFFKSENCEQNYAWSEEDKEHIDSLLKRLDGLCRNEFERTRFAISEDKDWLKQLKERLV